MRRLGLVAAVGLLLVADKVRGDAKADELAKLQGVWQLISAETGETMAPEAQVKQIRLTIQGNTHVVTLGDQTVARDIAFEIDPTKSPKEVTDTVTEEAGKIRQIKGIYRLVGDTLVSCVAAKDKERPRAFESKPGSGQTLRIFRRVKPIDAAKQAAIEAEQKKLDGSWRFASIETEGKPVSPDRFKDDRLVLKANRLTMTEGPVTHRGVYEVDPLATPKTIDVIFTEGPGKGQTSLGIYTTEGETLKVCVGLKGSARPTAFERKPDGASAVLVLSHATP